MEDHSTSNPGLHELYTNWAMQHLIVINQAIEDIGSYSNLNLDEILGAMIVNRRKLIMGNAAYRDAAARLMADLQPVDDVDEPVACIKKPEYDETLTKFQETTPEGGAIVLGKYPESGYWLRYNGEVVWREQGFKKQE